QITPAHPIVMDEGADGTLFASFGGDGTWRYDYASNTWSQLSPYQASAMSAASDNTLFASMEWGTYEYNTTGWHYLTPSHFSQLAAVRNDFFYGSSSGSGIWRYFAGSLTNISSYSAIAMDAATDGTLWVSLPTGTFSFSGSNTWIQI